MSFNTAKLDSGVEKKGFCFTPHWHSTSPPLPQAPTCQVNSSTSFGSKIPNPKLGYLLTRMLIIKRAKKMNKIPQWIVWPCWIPCEASEMEHLWRYILTDRAGVLPFNSPWGLSTLKVRKLRKFRCVKIFCHPIHCPLEDGHTGCKVRFVTAVTAAGSVKIFVSGVNFSKNTHFLYFYH